MLNEEFNHLDLSKITTAAHNDNSFPATFDPSALSMKGPPGENNIDLTLKKALLLIAFTHYAAFISCCVFVYVDTHMHVCKYE